MSPSCIDLEHYLHRQQHSAAKGSFCTKLWKSELFLGLRVEGGKLETRKEISVECWKSTVQIYGKKQYIETKLSCDPVVYVFYNILPSLWTLIEKKPLNSTFRSVPRVFRLEGLPCGMSMWSSQSSTLELLCKLQQQNAICKIPQFTTTLDSVRYPFFLEMWRQTWEMIVKQTRWSFVKLVVANSPLS